jgi:tRNA A-37 threonylcarbamoyl transferase component Bud32
VSVERSPVDLLRLVVAAVALLSLLLLSWLAGDTLVPFAADLLRGLDAVPTRLLDLVVVVTRVLTAAVLVGGLAWTAVRNGWRAVLTIGAAAALGAVLVPLLGDLAGVDDGAVVAVPDIALGPLTSGWFPTAAGIAAGLGAVGLALRRIDPASVDARGSTPYFAVTDHGEHLFVKALGQDERSADLLFRLYRWAARHDLGDERPFSSLRRAVEHEALVALAARDLGIRTPRLRAVATAEPASFVLAYDAVDGRSLDRVTNDELTDEVLTTIWQLLGDLRRHRIAHRDLRLANLFVGADGTVWLIDFGFAELAASDLLLANDVAELVASSAAVVGAERAVAPAIGSVDAATRAAAAERLQPWALSGATRTALKGRPGLLDELRRRLGAP